MVVAVIFTACRRNGSFHFESRNDSAGEYELKIPTMLERNKGEGIEYTVRAKKGRPKYSMAIKRKRMDNNGSFLGPMLRLEKGETVKIRTISELDEETTFHWHGLELSGEEDGGPHNSL